MAFRWDALRSLPYRDRLETQKQHFPYRLSIVPPTVTPGAMTARVAGSRWDPDVVGRVRRPAHPGGRLAAVVVRAAAAGQAVRVPPVQQAAAVRVPAAGGAQSPEEMGRTRHG